MAKAAHSILDMIGNTPLLRLPSLERQAGTGAQIWAKCEFYNPGGSVKDRAARQMMLSAIKDGLLTPERGLIDSTSGNTGVAYSMIGAALGIPVTLVMPGNVSAARKNITQAYGTTLIFSSELEGSDGAIRMVQDIVAREPQKYFYPDQYSNANNPGAHYATTGVEIWEQTAGKVTHFVTGIGTSGSLIGTGRRLKDYNQDIKVFGLQPDDSWHGLEGLKHLPSSIVPAIYQPDRIVDETVWMPTDEGWAIAEALVHNEGLFVGHSSGANAAGALRVAKQCGPGDLIVTLLCDRGDRYFTPLAWEKHYVW